MVVRQNPGQPERPVIRLLADDGGRRVDPRQIDLTRDRVADLVGISPLSLPRYSAVVDNCRIDLDAVRTILADLPEVLDTGVFVVDSRLVAYKPFQYPLLGSSA